MTTWLTTPLGDRHFPIVMIDGIHLGDHQGESSASSDKPEYPWMRLYFDLCPRRAGSRQTRGGANRMAPAGSSERVAALDTTPNESADRPVTAPAA